MGLENSNSSKPAESSDQPNSLGQEANQEAIPSSGSDSISLDAPLDSSLLSMMQSLTPNAPATSGDSAPQYPSLEAAVEIKQQVAPTLTNLLAAKTQDTPLLSLGNPGLAALAAELPSGSQGGSPASNAPEHQAPTDPAPSNLAGLAEEESVTTPSAPSLQDEQGPLGGQAIAVELPGSDKEAIPSPVDAPAQAEHNEQDASWEAIATESNNEMAPLEVVSSETVDESTTDGASAANPAMTSTSLQDDPDDAAQTAESETELSTVQAEESPSETREAGDYEEGQSNNPQPDDEDFEQVKEGAAESDRAQVLIKREDTHVAVIFPKEEASANPDISVEFIDSQLWQDLQQRLSGGTDFASNTPVHLYSQNCLLDTRQLQELDEALGRFNLKLVRIITSRRQTAVAAAMSGYSADQTNNLPELLSKEVHSPRRIGLAEPLYLQKNIRSGTEIRHPGSVVIMGDLNPGSSVIADGDILVWGRLRGIAHAGAAGSKTSIVMALKLEAPQLRIAGAVARVDAQGKGTPSPEIAYINDKSIRITSAYGFNRNELS